MRDWEAADLQINGGNIHVNASDDGLNAAGGNDGSGSSSTGGWGQGGWGGGMSSSTGHADDLWWLSGCQSGG